VPEKLAILCSSNIFAVFDLQFQVTSYLIREMISAHRLTGSLKLLYM
jgi:hypothetical protein